MQRDLLPILTDVDAAPEAGLGDDRALGRDRCLTGTEPVRASVKPVFGCYKPTRISVLLIGLAFGALFALQSLHASEPTVQRRVAMQASGERAKFPHDKPKHKTLDCSKCHSISPAKIDVAEYPKHAVCV